MEISDFLNITHNDVTRDFLYENFAHIDGNEEKFDSNKLFILKDEDVKPDSIIRRFSNYKDLIGKETNLGRIIISIFLYTLDITDEDGKVIGNTVDKLKLLEAPFSNKTIKIAENKLSQMMITKEINADTMTDYIDRLEWLSCTLCSFNLPSIDMKLLNPSKAIRDNTSKELNSISTAIEANDVVTFSNVENKVIKFAQNELEKEGSTGKLIYDSGFNGSWSNNYKVTSLMRGVTTKSNNGNEFNISTSNLVDGITKEDLPAFADLIILGAAGRAVDTRKGGYLTKIFNSAFGSIVAGKKGSDCKVKKYLRVKITNKYIFRYFIENGKLNQLTYDNIDKYIGKELDIRTPLACESREICNKCLGDMAYNLGIRNVGLHISRISNRIMNFSMKKFHNMVVTPSPYNIFDFITEKTKE